MKKLQSLIDLLESVKSIDFAQVCKTESIPNDNQLTVVSIDDFMAKAKTSGLSLRKGRGMIYIDNNSGTLSIQHEDIKALLSEVALKQGINYFTAKDYRFGDNLLKQLESQLQIYRVN